MSLSVPRGLHCLYVARSNQLVKHAVVCTFLLALDTDEPGGPQPGPSHVSNWWFVTEWCKYRSRLRDCSRRIAKITKERRGMLRPSDLLITMQDFFFVTSSRLHNYSH